MTITQGIALIIFSLLLCACEEGHHYAPVTEINAIESLPKSGMQQVKSGETLYEIAWRYGLDYRDLAERNNLNPPYTLNPGQTLLLRDRLPQVIIKTSLKPVVANIESPPKAEPTLAISGWYWPANGKIIRSFSNLHKGINIAGKEGDAVFASAAGKVVYCGNGLRRYGNLIILKHNHLFLSAYAHNRVILVKEGDWVSSGQKIAEIGNTGTNEFMLHFEIRRAGKPINPMALLK